MSSERCTRGYTLVELLVVLFIFGIVMTLISVSFARLVRNSSQLIRGTETDIGGLVGLELMRSDLELAGYGLYGKLPDGKNILYSEANTGLTTVYNCPDGCPETKPHLYDDSTYTTEPYIPRAYRLGNNVGYNGSDYLVLKGTPLGISRVSRNWGYVDYSSGIVSQPPHGEDEQLFVKEDRGVVLRSAISAGMAVRELVMSGNNFSLKYDDPLPEEFRPRDSSDSYLVYGVDKRDEKGLALAFPFNRADYYISRPTRISSMCAEGTGVLYKSVITQTGQHSQYPILDCVGDMQVLLYWDMDLDGIVDYSDEVIDEIAGSAAEFREKLKEIRVYILAQQGRKDSSYSYPVTNQEKAVAVGDGSLGRFWSASQMAATFGADWRNYHWKLYTIVVQPKNL